MCLAAAACGPKKPTAAELEAARQTAELRARAETRVLEGCYDCLLEAKAAYTKLATGTSRPEVLVRLFEVELLLGLREKELAMTSDAAASLGRARSLAPELPPQAAAAAERYLAAAEAAVPDETGLPVAAGRDFRRQTVKYAQGLDTEIAWLLADSSLQLPVRQYVALALDCSYFRRGRPVLRPAVTGQPIAATPARPDVMQQIPADAPAVVRYRAGFCDMIRRAPLEQVRKEEPRYAEAAYFLARLDIARAQETGAPGARQLLAEAYGRFPASPAVTYLNGNYQQLIGDCKAALRFYLETIAIEKRHDNALLGRTVCFAFLKRFDESMASASEMIEIPSSNLAEAFYWRAWVKHVLKRFDDARADIEKAKQILSNNDIHRLAGIIEYDQEDHLNAHKDLTTAKSMHGGESDCVARWYLGLNDMKRLRWLESAINFEDAMYCYERAALYAAEGLKKMQAAENVDPDFKARQIVGFEAAIKEDTAQQYASAFNAANHYARAGDRAKARGLVEVAARDPALDARVTELRRILAGGR
jgi:tetratricopeptide (TPR) repeat protein